MRIRWRWLDICPPDETLKLCGLAVDIGTTSVAALIVDMRTGKILAKGSTGNGQIRYGADVINRIIESMKPGGRKKLQDAGHKGNVESPDYTDEQKGRQ